jgi:hypothetical protein
MPKANPRKSTKPTIVDVHFRAAWTRDELIDAFLPGAPALGKVRGMRWKIWSFNSQTREFVGYYLFDGPKEAQAYIEGPVIRGLSKEPSFSNVEVRTFEALPELSQHTRGPLG